LLNEKQSLNEIIIDPDASARYSSDSGPQDATLGELINHELDHYEKFLDPDYDYTENRKEYPEGHEDEDFYSKLEKDAVEDTNKYRKEMGKCDCEVRNSY
jgi:hypothetical protein